MSAIRKLFKKQGGDFHKYTEHVFSVVVRGNNGLLRYTLDSFATEEEAERYMETVDTTKLIGDNVSLFVAMEWPPTYVPW